ncbi:hypothetical protein PINS_up022664 [Pythium insidiosum]|nr:hypothetical protein PINS_up022664 [Pythium insidiosum]
MTVSQAYHIEVRDVKFIQISKRVFEVYNSGPELLNVPTLRKLSRSLEMRDQQVIEFLLSKCWWTPWHPPTSWRTKTDQTFDLVVHSAKRRDGFLTGEIVITRLRVGRKWVGPHHHDASLSHVDKTTWLHRTDYEITERELTAESLFYQTINKAWVEFLEELSRVPKEDLLPNSDTGDGFAYDKQEQRTSLRVKYLVETSLDKILNDRSTMFRALHQYEQWRMEQEDKLEHRTTSEDAFAGPLMSGHIDELSEFYETQAMTTEDVKVLF